MARLIEPNIVHFGWILFRKWSHPRVSCSTEHQTLWFVTIDENCSEYQWRWNPLETWISSISRKNSTMGLLLCQIFRFIGEKWREIVQLSWIKAWKNWIQRKKYFEIEVHPSIFVSFLPFLLLSFINSAIISSLPAISFIIFPQLVFHHRRHRFSAPPHLSVRVPLQPNSFRSVFGSLL